MRLRSLTAGMTLLLALTACTGGSPARAAATPGERLAAAKAAMDRAGSVHLVLGSRDIPSSAGGVLGADGVGTAPPRSRAPWTPASPGCRPRSTSSPSAPRSTSSSRSAASFVRTDPATYHAPDPARLFAAQGGLSHC